MWRSELVIRPATSWSRQRIAFVAGRRQILAWLRRGASARSGSARKLLNLIDAPNLESSGSPEADWYRAERGSTA